MNKYHLLNLQIVGAIYQHRAGTVWMNEFREKREEGYVDIEWNRYDVCLTVILIMPVNNRSSFIMCGWWRKKKKIQMIKMIEGSVEDERFMERKWKPIDMFKMVYYFTFLFLFVLIEKRTGAIPNGTRDLFAYCYKLPSILLPVSYIFPQMQKDLRHQHDDVF